MDEWPEWLKSSTIIRLIPSMETSISWSLQKQLLLTLHRRRLKFLSFATFQTVDSRADGPLLLELCTLVTIASFNLVSFWIDDSHPLCIQVVQPIIKTHLLHSYFQVLLITMHYYSYYFYLRHSSITIPQNSPSLAVSMLNPRAFLIPLICATFYII